MREANVEMSQNVVGEEAKNVQRFALEVSNPMFDNTISFKAFTNRCGSWRCNNCEPDAARFVKRWLGTGTLDKCSFIVAGAKKKSDNDEDVLVMDTKLKIIEILQVRSRSNREFSITV